MVPGETKLLDSNTYTRSNEWVVHKLFFGSIMIGMKLPKLTIS